MKTVKEVIALSTEYLEKLGLTSPRLHAEEVLAATLLCKRLDLYMHYDRPLQESELMLCRERLKRRGRHEPLEYIVGSTEFFGCCLELTQDVLIPRQETEILLSKALEKLRAVNLEGKTAWDLCTGSGCLALGLKKALPGLDVVASDLSHRALEVAKKNARKNAVEITFLHGDLFQPFSGKKCDIIFCNPPYVSEKEYPFLEKEVKDFEPKAALVSGDTGLEFYERLARELPSYLHSPAYLFFEIGTGQGEKVKSFFQPHSRFTYTVEKDWAGHDRFFFLEFQ